MKRLNRENAAVPADVGGPARHGLARGPQRAGPCLPRQAKVAVKQNNSKMFTHLRLQAPAGSSARSALGGAGSWRTGNSLGGCMMGGVQHTFVTVNGVRLHVAKQGQGPLVVLLHGFPESWYSWRHQFGPLAAAGYRVIAPDQRGYARSAQPEAVEAYSLLHLVGDVIALVDALGEESVVLVGHDWGAAVAWITALLRPDVVRAVAGLSVPPVLPAGMTPPSVTRKKFGDGFYQVGFQEPGVADAALARDPLTTFRRILFGGSGDNPSNDPPGPWIVPSGGTFLDVMPEPRQLP